MAEQKKISPVLLGYVDEEITAKYASALNSRASKIGGLPDWGTAPGCDVPMCRVCSCMQVLVVQIYVPLQTCPDHRTLYVFACLSPSCWGNNHSWSVVRIQLPSSPVPEIQPKVSSSADVFSSNKGSSGVFDVGGDWGSDSEDDDDDYDNANTGNNNIPLHSSNTETIANLNFNRNANEVVSNANDRRCPPPTSSSNSYINNALGNNAAAAAATSINSNNKNMNVVCNDNPMDTNDSSAATIAMQFLNLNQGVGNGNNGGQMVVGAVGEAGVTECEADEATAVIEGAEGDMVAVDSPDLPQQDIARWFKTPSPTSSSYWTRTSSLSSYFLACDEEVVVQSKGEVMTTHERQLLQHYTAHSHAEVTAVREEGGDISYVKSVPIHGDVYFQKFKKRISHAPDQVLRYCRDSSSGPLLMSPLKGLDISSKCRSCNAPLVFEMQLMPQLISHLKPSNSNTNNKPSAPEQFSSPPIANVNETEQQSPRHCKSTRSKHVSTSSKKAAALQQQSSNASVESQDSIDTQDSMDSSNVPQHSPKIKSKGNRNRNQCRDGMMVHQHDGVEGTSGDNSNNVLQQSNNRVMSSGVIEYGTVLIFTCSQSCWRGRPVFEVPLVQREVI